MDTELKWFREGLEGLSVQELKDMLVEEHAKRMQEHEGRIREHEERMRENMRLLEFERSSTAMSREYRRIQDKLAAAEKELSKSRALCKKLQEQNDSLAKHRFGRHSEKTDVLFESADDPNEDPLAEEHMPEPEGRTSPPLNFEAAARKLAGKTGTRGSKRKGKRRYADAFSLLDLKGLTEEQVQELPEAAAIRMIRDIYHEENLLRGLPAKERLLMRRQKVRPKVDAFFRFADEFDAGAPGVSNKMKDAVMYTRNQKKYLCRFLEDGNIPLDNGNAERCMKPVAQGRRAYLFSTSIDGAKANTIIYSLVETARKNGADPYYYLKFVLEKMPGHLDGKDRSFLAEMMPWTDTYKRYESAERNRPFRTNVPESQTCPPWRQITDNVS